MCNASMPQRSVWRLQWTPGTGGSVLQHMDAALLGCAPVGKKGKLYLKAVLVLAGLPFSWLATGWQE